MPLLAWAMSSSGKLATFSTPVESNTIELVQERLDSWTLTLNVTIDYFIELARTENVMFRAHQKLASTMAQSVSTGSAVGSTPASPKSEGRSNFWLGPLQAYSLQTAGGSESLWKYIKEETLARLEGLRDEFFKRSKEIKERLGRLQKGIGKEHDGLMKAMKEHERLWLAKLEIPLDVDKAALVVTSSNLSPIGTVEQKDVWLSEVQLHAQIEGFLEEKGKFCRELHQLYTDTRLLNADCSRQLSSCISEYFTVRSKQCLAQAEQTKDVQRAAVAIEPEAEWLQALIRSRLDYEWSLEAPPIDGFTASVLQQISSELHHHQNIANGSTIRSINVLKSGLLMRPGSTFGPAWTVLFGILTDSNYLHLYPVKAKKTSKSDYHVPTPDDQLNQKHLNDLNLTIANSWGLLDNTSVDRRRLCEPILSVPLFEGVAVSVESPNENIWSVNVPGGASSFFGGRADKHLVLKSFIEEDMVNWCIAIKDVISRSIAEAKLVCAKATARSRTSASPEATPTWTHRQVSNQITEEEDRPNIYGLPSPFHDHEGDDDDNVKDEEGEDDLAHGLSGLSISTGQVEPIRSASTSQPTFTLDNPWD